jgi:hypothetical protein
MVTTWRDSQRVHVDDRVFPDLRIDEAPEGKGKGALQQALPGCPVMLDHGIVDGARIAACHGWSPGH